MRRASATARRLSYSTANAITGAREEYMKKGFDEFMTKPIDVEVLQKILMKYLK